MALSQKLLRICTVIIAASLTMIVLIGATVFYNKFFYTSPLEASVKKLAAVGSFQVETENSQTRLRVRFNTAEKLRTSFYLLLDQLHDQALRSPDGVTLVIENTANETLRQFLSDARLPVFEAISTGQFTSLPANLDSLRQQIGSNRLSTAAGAALTYELELDNSFIFLTANYGTDSAHIVISRGNSSLLIINTMGSEYL